MRQNVQVITFNRGIVDARALSRIDIEKIMQSCEVQTNYLPSILGSMMLRQGTAYKNETKSNLTAQLIPFIFSSSDSAIIEFTNGIMRVLIDDVVLTRPTVSTVITNDEFTSNLTGWTDVSEAGASVIYSLVFGGSARFLGANNGKRAILRKTLSVGSGDIGTEHGIRIYMPRGRITVRIGSTTGGNEYFYGVNLGVGYHSISVIPSGNIYIQLESCVNYYSYISEVKIETGDVEIPTPYYSSYIGQVRHTQSADVIFMACSGISPRKIVRRSVRSWSIEEILFKDGAFLSENITPTKISSSGTSGNVTLTASNDLFESGHVGGLISITPSGQTVTASISAQDTFSDTITVDGVGTSRQFTITITGTWTATITLQKSFDDGLSWEDTTSVFTTNITTTFNDLLDNVEILYRIGIKTGDYTSGTANVTLSYARGSTTGIYRIYEYTDATTVVAEVLKSPKSTASTDNWSLGAWNDYEGYPSAIALHEGRLWLAKANNVYGSVSDAYESFDETLDGDSKAINKTIGSGAVDSVYWLLPLNRLIIGLSGGQREIRSSSFDEPLTPTASTIKIASDVQSSNIHPASLDIAGLFISGKRLYSLNFSSENFGYDANNLTVLAPNIAGSNPFIQIGVSRNPETKVHCVRSDGKVAILSYDNTENLQAWSLYETDGAVENVVVLPNIESSQDKIYYIVRRTIDGVTKRYYELWAEENECIGSGYNKNLDCHKAYSSGTTLTGLSHLEGKTVYAWGNNKDLGTYIVSSGSITLSESATNIVVGLGYEARYKTVKLPYASQIGTGLTQKKIISAIGFNLANTHIQPFKYGRDFTDMYDLPIIYKWTEQAEDAILTTYDDEMFSFNGTFDSDSRVCIKAYPNRPHTITALILGIETHEKG